MTQENAFGVRRSAFGVGRHPHTAICPFTRWVNTLNAWNHACTTPNAERRTPNASNTSRLLVLLCIFFTSPFCAGGDADINRLLAAYVFVGSGSGVVVSANGLVLTNHHVVGDETDLPVRFIDGTVRPTRRIGSDPVGDLDLLRITEAENLPHVVLATEADLRVGDAVIAIGNPFALGELDDTPTVTYGILSAVRLVREDYADALQVDAAVNPGNSGGPLFDRQGRLLGINGQIRTRSGFRVNSGIALAIACTQIAAFLPHLQDAEGGYVRHTAAPPGLELKGDETGAVVVQQPGRSGLTAGDHLLTVAGRPAVTAERCRGLFTALPWRDDATIPVTVRRGGTVLDLRVPAGRTPIPGRPWHGVEIGQQDGGLFIDAVEAGSPGADAGLAAGDAITALDGKPVRSRLDWIRHLARHGIGDRLRITCRRGTVEQQVVVRLERKRD